MLFIAQYKEWQKTIPISHGPTILACLAIKDLFNTVRVRDLFPFCIWFGVFGAATTGTMEGAVVGIVNGFAYTTGGLVILFVIAYLLETVLAALKSTYYTKMTAHRRSPATPYIP